MLRISLLPAADRSLEEDLVEDHAKNIIDCMKNFLFLLGGQDLEMITIQQLLERQGITFLDNGLSWGAKWSDYQAEIDQFDWENKQLVGIELGGEKPERAILIDHHNQRSNKPASIIQVADLVRVKLSRYEQLVAANDAGYIPAMRNMGASEEEIQLIRRKDRKAQGVTEEMEQIAEKELQKIILNESVIVLKTILPKFSPIVDRLQVPRLLVYTLSELTYFGNQANEVATLLNSEISSGKAYYGGGPNGFVGIGSGHFSEFEIRLFVERILSFLKSHVHA